MLSDTSVESNKISDFVCYPDGCKPYSVSVKGGGIFNSGTAVLNRCSIDKNFANAFRGDGGGMYNSGQMTLLATTITQNSGFEAQYFGLKGPGLFNDTSGMMAILDGSVTGNSWGATQAIVNQGILTLKRTTVAANVGWRGGGLSNTGTAMLLECSVSHNETYAGGGNWREAGGITNWGSLTLVGSTISNNYATTSGSGGIANFGGSPSADQHHGGRKLRRSWARGVSADQYCWSAVRLQIMEQITVLNRLALTHGRAAP